jgi:uncharacterized protein DUF4190
MTEAKGPVSRLAVAALICGVLWVFGLGSLLAVVLGHLARRRIVKGNLRGGGLALAGLVLGYLGLVVLAVLLLQGGVTVEDNAS